jgi:hypothetical protein
MNPPPKDRLWSPVLVLSFALVGLALVALAACGGNGGGGKTTPQPSATVAQTGPGTITLSSSAITGQSGKMLLVFAMPQGGTGPMARACVPITSDPFAVPSTVMIDVGAGQDPCSGSTPETKFPEGSYSVTAGVYVPGTQTAAVQTTQTVRVSGDVTVKVDGAALSQ